jgi:serine/threonine protein kinase
MIAAQHSADKIFDRPPTETILEMLAESPASQPPANALDPTAIQTASEVADAQRPGQTQFIRAVREPFLLQPGVEIDGRYLIERELDRGGFGSVLLARDTKLYHAQVVIKVLRHFGQGEQSSWYEKKFRQEAKALSRMNHPGIVRAQDVGDLPDGRPYIVMEYVPGQPLRAAISQHGMDLERAGKLLHQIAAALSAAHEQGVIHRDLKPENVMLQSIPQSGADEEHVKLIDFGIATIREHFASTSTEQTEAAGTRAYMAPEQLLGKPSRASDIYALGVIAYEMVTGRRPFNPDSAFQLLDLQRSGVKVMPCDLRESLPPLAQGAILKALSYDPANRYATAREFSEAFNRALAEDSGIRHAATASRSRAPSGDKNARARQRSRSARFWLLIAALLIPLVIGFFVWRQLSHQPPEVLPERQLVYWLTFRRNPQVYPDSQIIRLTRSVIFDKGDLVRLHISSPQSGYLYVINEGPLPNQGQPSYVFLFPYSLVNGFSAELKPGAPLQIPLPTNDLDQDWFEMDVKKGVEKVWLIWSESPVPQMEAVKHYANHTDQGTIGDPAHIKLVSLYLSEHSVNKPESEEDETNKQTILKVKGNALVGLVKLEHH